MRSKYKKLTLKQLDEVFNLIRPIKSVVMPSKGWVRAIRDALGMSARQLANRMDVKQQRIVRIEQDEKLGRVTLNTMKSAAEALDCDFIYALVSKESLQQTVKNQARRVAAKRMSRSNQMMRLEKQELTDSEKQKVLDDIVDEILNTMPRNLWDE